MATKPIGDFLSGSFQNLTVTEKKPEESRVPNPLNHDEVVKINERSEKIEFHKLSEEEMEAARKSLQEALDAPGSPIASQQKKEMDWKYAINEMHL